MQSKKKMIVNTVFLVVIFALTIYGVFHGEDLGAMMEAMRRADVRWLLPGLFCVVFFIWGESIIIWYMMHSFQIPVKKRTCFLFSSVGFFFSCITPSASGGQPMQLYYMKKEKISLPVSTVILMIVTITYKAVLVNVLAITFAQRFALFAATWFVYRAFHLSGVSFITIVLLQAVISVSVDMLPLPGGMGISETLFLKIFPPVFGSTLLLPAMVLSRGLGYYGELLVSAVFTIVAQLTIGNTKREKRGGTTYDRVL